MKYVAFLLICVFTWFVGVCAFVPLYSSWSHYDKQSKPTMELRTAEENTPSGLTCEKPPSPLEENQEWRSPNLLRFNGIASLYANKDKKHTINNTVVLERLRQATVLVVGIGGVGSWAAEALCRSGVGTIVLMDLDDICISNTNRQLHATKKAIGKLKTEVMRDRLLSINPECHVQVWNDFCSQENVDHVITSIPQLSACLDAIDENSSKTALIAACSRHRIPIVTCGGSAGLSDPTAWILEDLTRANGDSLLSKCRKNLRQMHGFTHGASFRCDDGTIRKPPRRWNIRAVFSTEPVGKRTVSSSWRTCDGPLGTACFVTGAAGFIAAGEIVSQIAQDRYIIPKRFSGGNNVTKSSSQVT